MFEEIKALEAQLAEKRKEAVSSLLKQREEIDRQLAELGHGGAAPAAPAPTGKRRGRKPKNAVA